MLGALIRAKCGTAGPLIIMAISALMFVLYIFEQEFITVANLHQFIIIKKAILILHHSRMTWMR